MVLITKGTRQGCPLSPILFILTLEPFIRRLMLKQNIQGFQLAHKEYKKAAYADDLLFFMTKLHISLSNLMKEFSHFDYIFNLKINYTKSEAMNINIPDMALKIIQNNCPFKWRTSALQYLWIWLTPQLSQVFKKNFLPLLKAIGKELTLWHPRTFSWFGRAAICKMTILPRIVYLFRTLPIKIPPSFFKTLQSIQLNFVWAHKRPRIKFTLLTRPKEQGGIGLPDYRNYYYASHITRNCHSDLKDWVSLENDPSPIPLKFSPWISWTKYPPDLKQHPLINTTLSIFHLLTKNPDLSSPLSPLTPLQNNPDYPPGVRNRLLQSSDPNIAILTKHCFHDTQMKDFHTLKSDTLMPHLPLWTYFKIRSFVNNTRRRGHFIRHPTELEPVCLKGDHIPRATSLSYAWLQKLKQSFADRFRESWLRDLSIELTDQQRLRACILAHKCSLFTRMQEMAFKQLTQCYATPAKLHKWYSQTTHSLQFL